MIYLFLFFVVLLIADGILYAGIWSDDTPLWWAAVPGTGFYLALKR